MNGVAPTDLWKILADGRDGRHWALVTLLDAEGSTPAARGSRAIVDAGGAITGTIGGGALEGFAMRTALQAIRTGRPAVFDFNLQGAGPPAPDPICGGRLKVLVDPRADRHRTAYALADQARRRRARGILLTRVSSVSQVPAARRKGNSSPDSPAGPKVRTTWLDESALEAHDGFPDPNALRTTLRRESTAFHVQPRRRDAGYFEVLVEAVVPQPRLVIVGGGHVGQALALQASLVGFDIAVIDDREEFTCPTRFPDGTETRTGKLAETLAAFPFSDDTYIALVTRGHRSDAEALQVCLRQPHAYLGMIGSRRKISLVKRDFIASGRATPEEWKAIHAPIGLDIAALTVPEIATSIVAQLIAVRRNGRAGKHPDR